MKKLLLLNYQMFISIYSVFKENAYPINIGSCDFEYSPHILISQQNQIRS